jgi:hypothetical protein
MVIFSINTASKRVPLQSIAYGELSNNSFFVVEDDYPFFPRNLRATNAIRIAMTAITANSLNVRLPIESHLLERYFRF